jgi:hypothetical protein
MDVRRRHAPQLEIFRPNINQPQRVRAVVRR